MKLPQILNFEDKAMIMNPPIDMFVTIGIPLSDFFIKEMQEYLNKIQMKGFVIWDHKKTLNHRLFGDFQHISLERGQTDFQYQISNETQFIYCIAYSGCPQSMKTLESFALWVRSKEPQHNKRIIIAFLWADEMGFIPTLSGVDATFSCRRDQITDMAMNICAGTRYPDLMLCHEIDEFAGLFRNAGPGCYMNFRIDFVSAQNTEYILPQPPQPGMRAFIHIKTPCRVDPGLSVSWIQTMNKICEDMQLNEPLVTFQFLSEPDNVYDVSAYFIPRS